MAERQHPLIGKTIASVYLTSDGGAIRFDLSDGSQVHASAYGECCSHSWIETIQGLDQIIDSPIVSVEDVAMPDLGSNGETDRAINRYGHYEEEMAYYGCKITSEKGYAVIDYRNSSNGYYGGSLSWDGEYFYGGVHGQNEAKGEWHLVEA